ncbi:FAD-dependent oxidoreductase [Acidovorax sp. SUPP2522]|uniref:FAD-dependent oxidoreductase n=1 Tax=unclassified Acidovorax TaxID=2684926 RepID=UPI0023492325|nr:MULTISPECIES: FAD-dependent oxidoreductase [unclassified Acidovorax]WCM99417.1 FAD-dependent oxidoreductase [Acidovorax sp. GBBC 1281]GKT16266.1 FAD-dependent oxidoreductase [Acidovorax sp. SUPP2522]
MHIAIVGAGIVGVTTAYELTCDGHEVSVFEQRSAAAEESSFANAGLSSPALLIPLTAPGIGGPQSTRLWGRHAAVRLAKGVTASELRWLWRWRKAGRSPALPMALSALEQLGRYSQARMRWVSEQLQVDAETGRGALVLLRTVEDLAHVQPALQLLRDAGMVIHDVDAETARQIEPGLSPDTPLIGALHIPDGESSNCRLFAQMLRYAAQERGAQFHFNAQVTGLDAAPAGLRIAGETLPRRFDAVVVCAGVAAAALLRPLGAELPMAALHGYSISAPVREDSHAPQGSVVDPLHRVTITRQGQRVRIAGGTELGRGDGAHHAPTLQTLYQAISGWFPGGVQVSSGQVQVWRGARPTLPDGAPVVGPSGLPGVWVNAGHGGCGYALASGSARALADLMAQRAPEVDLQHFALRRF